MKVISPPDTEMYSDLFLGGGISNCPPWQDYIIDQLRDTDLTLCNPRNSSYTDSEECAKAQIKWEHQRLNWHTSARLFWFCEETLCPITLFELGKFCYKYKKDALFVGCHPNYKRKLDVVEQMKLERKDIEVVFDLDDIIRQVKEQLC